MNIAVRFMWKKSLKKISDNIRSVENALYKSAIEIPVNFLMEIATEENHKKYHHS
jgi:hypothetical protein